MTAENSDRNGFRGPSSFWELDQETVMRELADTLGVQPEFFEDLGASGQTPAERLGLQLAKRMRRDARRSPALPCDLGEVVLESFIAEGGMAAVYRGRMRATGRRVAVKVAAADSRDARALRNEIEKLPEIDSVHVVSLVAHGENCGLVWAAMDLVEGVTLMSLLRRRRDTGESDVEFAASMESESGAAGTKRKAKRPRLSPAELRRFMGWLAQLARTLDVLSAAGIAHRDLSPNNVMIEKSGTPVLIDFGLAVDDDDDFMGIIAGTVPYMSPEHTSAGFTDLDVRSDIYSLAVAFHELLTGNRVVQITSGRKLRDGIPEINHGIIPPPSAGSPGVPKTLDPIFAQALKKDLRLRYQSGEELATDIELWLDGRKPRHAAENLGASLERRRRPFMIAAGLALAILVTGTVWWQGSRREATDLRERLAAIEADLQSRSPERVTASQSRLRELGERIEPSRFARLEADLEERRATLLSRRERRRRIERALSPNQPWPEFAALRDEAEELGAADEKCPETGALRETIRREEQRRRQLIADFRREVGAPGKEAHEILESARALIPEVGGQPTFDDLHARVVATRGPTWIKQVLQTEALPYRRIEAKDTRPWALAAREHWARLPRDPHLCFLVCFDDLLSGKPEEVEARLSSVAPGAMQDPLVIQARLLAAFEHRAQLIEELERAERLRRGLRTGYVGVDEVPGGPEALRGKIDELRAAVTAAEATFSACRLRADRDPDAAFSLAAICFRAYVLVELERQRTLEDAKHQVDRARLEACRQALGNFTSIGRPHRLALCARARLSLALGDAPAAAADLEGLLDDPSGRIDRAAARLHLARALVATPVSQEGEAALRNRLGVTLGSALEEQPQGIGFVARGFHSLARRDEYPAIRRGLGILREIVAAGRQVDLNAESIRFLGGTLHELSERERFRDLCDLAPVVEELGFFEFEGPADVQRWLPDARSFFTWAAFRRLNDAADTMSDADAVALARFGLRHLADMPADRRELYENRVVHALLVGHLALRGQEGPFDPRLRLRGLAEPSEAIAEVNRLGAYLEWLVADEDRDEMRRQLRDSCEKARGYCESLLKRLDARADEVPE
jgi:serine/threonine protein kinase